MTTDPLTPIQIANRPRPDARSATRTSSRSRSSRASRRRSSPSGTPTRRSRRRSRPAAGDRRRRRVRLLRRPAVRQRPAALRPPPHRLREGRGAALPDDARQAGRAPLRLGLPRPAGRDGGREGARLSGRQAITDYGIEQFNDTAATSVLQLHGGLGAVRHPPGALGRLRQRLPDHGPLLHGERHVGVQAAVGQGPRLRGLPGRCRTRGRCETPLSNFETRLDDAYRRARTRRSPSASSSTRSAGDAGRRARLLAWTTTPWTLPSNLALAVGPDVDYAVVECDEGTASDATSSARRASRAVRARARRRDTGRHAQRRRARRAHVQAAVPVLRRPRRTRSGSLAGDFVEHRRRHRRRAHRARLRRGRPARLRGERHQPRRPGRRRGRFTVGGARLRGPARLRRQHAHHPRPEGAAASSCATRPTTTTIRTAGAPTRRSSTRRSAPGSCRSPRSRTACSSSTRRSTGCPSTSATAASASGSRTRATGRSAATASGARRSRCGAATTPSIPRIDVYGSLDELERDFGVRPDDLHRPFVDELVRPNPDDPTGKSMMRRVPEVLDCWFESGSMPFAQVHYPFENKEWFESHYPGDFIVEYVAQTRGWFYTMHVLATALFDRPAFRNCICHGVVLDEDGQKLSKRLRNYPDPLVVFDTLRRRRAALVPAQLADPARRRPRRRRRRASARRCARCSCRSGTRGTSFALRERRRHPRHGPHRRPRRDGQCSTATSSPRPASLVEGVTASMDDYDLFAACAQVRGVPRRAEQLVRPPQPRPLLGRRPGRDRHAAHRAVGALPGRRAAAAAHDRGDLPRPHRRAQRAPRGLAGRRTSCRRTPRSSRAWTSPATSARRRCGCARRTSGGSACRCGR